LTELDAAKDLQNSQLSVPKMPQQQKQNSQYLDKGIIGHGLMSYHNSNYCTAESTGK